MLGKIVKVRVTSPYGYINRRYGFEYKLNFGIVESGKSIKNSLQFAYIMGICHPVKSFEGRVIAAIRRPVGKGTTWVVAPKSSRYINNDILPAIAFAEEKRSFTLDCLYESSCGAVVFRNHDHKKEYLLIRNRRSAHWGFPKGHIEPGETKLDTARREVLEETGVPIEFVDGFEETSEYTIQGKINKILTIFLGKSMNDELKMQEEEIAEIGWFDFSEALDLLNFDNDKRIFKRAGEYIEEIGI